MRALILKGRQNYDFTEVPTPEPREKQVLIKVDSCGLCGTDAHIYHGHPFANYPVIIGHEISGKVVRVGKKVKKLKEGIPAAVNPNMSCGTCYFCRKGKVHLCENLMNIGVRKNGGFAEYVVVDAEYVHSLSPTTDLEAASFVEPLSCCIHGTDRAGIKSGDRVLILGAGVVGLIILQLAKLLGASHLVAVDPVKKKRELAEKLGADFVLDPSKEDILHSTPEVLGQLPDVVFECVGEKEAMQKSWQIVSPGGKVVWFGVADPEEEIPVRPYQVFRKEITIAGSFVNPYTTQRAVQLLEKKRVKLKELISHRFSLDDFPKALNTFEKDKKRIKIIMKPYKDF